MRNETIRYNKNENAAWKNNARSEGLTRLAWPELRTTVTICCFCAAARPNVKKLLIWVAGFCSLWSKFVIFENLTNTYIFDVTKVLLGCHPWHYPNFFVWPTKTMYEDIETMHISNFLHISVIFWTDSQKRSKITDIRKLIDLDRRSS